jgi:hypothetical protein
MSCKRLLATAAVLLAFSSPASANDCEAMAAEIVSKLGAKIERRSTSTIFLQHGAVPGDLMIGCDSSGPADGPDVFLSWDTTDHPTDVFWSITGSMGAILTGASSQVIEDGARACYKRAKDGQDIADWARDSTHRSATVTRGDVRYECLLTLVGRGSFNVDILRRDAAKQREIDRQFDKSMAKKPK